MRQLTHSQVKGMRIKINFRLYKESPDYDHVSRISEREEFETPSPSPLPNMYQDDEIVDVYGSNAMKGSMIVKNSVRRSTKINRPRG